MMKQSTKGRKARKTGNEGNVRKVGKGKRREWILGAGLLAYLVTLMIRIPLSHIIGDQGMGFFAMGMEAFTLVSVVLSYGMARAVAVLVKYRVKREMFKSAKKVCRNAMLLAVILGTVAAAVFFIFAEFIASTLLLEHMGYMALAAVAPAMILAAVMGVLRGYFQGMGTMIPTVHSKLVVQIIMLAAGLLFGYTTYSYGRKIADFLQSSQYAAAYGAMGAAIGWSVACLFGVLHLLFIDMIYKGTFKQQLMKDTSKYTESNGQILTMLISTALPYMLCALLYNLNYLADQRIYNYVANVKGQTSRAVHWGIYYGKYSAVTGIVAVLCTLAVIGGIPKIMQAYERQAHKDTQFLLAKAIHSLAVVTIPGAVLLAVLAEPIVGVLFKGDRNTAVRLLQTGSCVTIFFPFAYFFMALLQRIRKINFVIISGLAAFLLHLLVLFLLVMNTEMGITAVACGLTVFWFTACVIGYIGVIRYMQYSQEWIRVYGIPTFSAAVAGFVGMLFVKLLAGLLGNAVTLLICLPLCILIYNVLLILLKGITEDELEDMPGGMLIVFLAQKLHLM